jgi:hypothetical protein
MKKLILATLSCIALLGAGSIAQAQTTLAQWSFSATQSGPLNTLTATLGSGTATQLGMTNSYTYANGEGPSSTGSCDISSITGSVSGSTLDGWRIRGNSNSKNSGAGKANGWNNSAPNYTQGAQFLMSTAGFSDVDLSFLWFSTAQGVGNLQVRYTLDGGGTWTNIGSDYVATAGDFYGAQAGTTPTPINVNFGSIAGAANDPGFGIELVSVQPVSTDSNYSFTNGNGDYASSTSGTYNNNSGNWSFANVTVTGASAVPEPSTFAAIGFGALALIGIGRRRLRKF